MAPRHKSKCTLTHKDTITPDSGGGWLINGHHRDNLDACTFKDGATITLGMGEADTGHEAPAPIEQTKPRSAPKINTPQELDTPPASPSTLQGAKPPAQAQSIQLPPEMAELQELINIYQSTQGLGPYAALAIVAAALWTKLNKAQKRSAQECDCELCRPRHGHQHGHRTQTHGHQHGHQHGHPTDEKRETLNENERCLVCGRAPTVNENDEAI